MALLTQAQADQAYLISHIEKKVEDSDPTKGIWVVYFTLDGEEYTYGAKEDELPMNATDQQIKAKFIEIALISEYKGVGKTYTTSVVNKI